MATGKKSRIHSGFFPDYQRGDFMLVSKKYRTRRPGRDHLNHYGVAKGDVARLVMTQLLQREAILMRLQPYPIGHLSRI